MNLYYRFKNWCVANKQELGFGAVIFLVATASFGLGYLANRENTRAPIVIEQCASSTPSTVK
ncbi:MAG: hypothetical protein HYW65_03785 [Candidatus Liptonbacteria bacterium]|nr:hypothetical protein [Candidatus Liptonbacteria bacterium]